MRFLRICCILLVVCFIINSVPVFATEAEKEDNGPQIFAREEKSDSEILADGVFSLLLWGNSFSLDAGDSTMCHLMNVLMAMLGPDVEIRIGYLVSGNKTFTWHATQIDRGTKPYTFQVDYSNSSKWDTFYEVSADFALKHSDWDVIIMQPYSMEARTGVSLPDSIPEDDDPKFFPMNISAPYLLDYVAQYAATARVYYYLIWSATTDMEKNAGLSDHTQMSEFAYDALEFTGNESGKGFFGLVPIGTAVQNARTTYLAELNYNSHLKPIEANKYTDPQIGLQRDVVHISFYLGRYIVLSTLAETVVPQSIRTPGYVLPAVHDTLTLGPLPQEYTLIARLAVEAAVNGWNNDRRLSVTEITGFENDPIHTAQELLKDISLEIPCAADEASLTNQIKEQLLSLLSQDFAVDSVEYSQAYTDLGQPQTLEILAKVRFGYSSILVPVTCNIGVHTYRTVVLEPSCEQEGKTTHTCQVCNHSYDTDSVDALGHDPVTDAAKAPSCTGEGLTEGSHCQSCGTVLVEQTTIPMTDHSWDGGTVTLEPTEETAGIRLFRCGGCGLERKEDMPKLEHVHAYEVTLTPPSCIRIGYSTFTCRCGDSYLSDYVPALGHDTVTEPAVQPTCTKPGMTEGSHCSRCKEVYSVQEEIPVREHSWDDGVVTQKPTETAVGVRCYTCGECGQTREEEIPKLNHTHSYSAKKTEPGCTEQGYTKYTCACGDSFTADYVKALGHDVKIDGAIPATCTEKGFTEGCHCARCGIVFMERIELPMIAHSFDRGVITKEPTEESTGVRAFTCSACGFVREETVSQLTHIHTFVSTQVQPTCNMQGYTDFSCSCGYSYIGEYVKALGHDLVTDEARAASCIQNGLSEGCHCVRCGIVLVEQEETPVIAHSWNEGAITQEPTESHPGIRTYTCDFCGKTRWEEVSQLQHQHTYTAHVTEPDCNAQGYTEYVCGCGYSYFGDYRKPLGHDVVIEPAVEATCTQAGLTQGKYCARCDTLLLAQEKVPPVAHNWDAGTVTKEPTEIDTGIYTYTCNVCKRERRETLPKLEHVHTYSSETVAPTCTTQGYTQYVCGCGYGYVEEYVSALGHDVVIDPAVEATCTQTGLTEGCYCGRCGAVLIQQQQIPVIAHSYTAHKQEATCTKGGLTVYVCACGYSYEADPVEPLGHTWGQWVETVKPDAVNDGVNTRMCTVCKETEKQVVDNNIFSDVKQDRFEDAILWAYYNKITTGTGDGTTFSPEEACTRKQIVTFLWRAAGEPEPKSMENPFTDVKADRFEKAILWAFYEGITTGTGDGTTFSPENTCTRKQIVTFLWRYNDQPAPESMENKFADVKNDRFAPAILWAAEQGITTGTGDGTTFSPEDPCTRKQIVTFLFRNLSEEE